MRLTVRRISVLLFIKSRCFKAPPIICRLENAPHIKELNAEYAQLLEQKKAAYPAYRKARAEMQEYLVAQKVAAVLLEKEKEQEAVEERRKQEQRTDQHR